MIRARARIALASCAGFVLVTPFVVVDLTSALRLVNLATTLLATFVFFPISSTHTVTVDEVRISKNGTQLIGNATAIPAMIHQIRLGGLEMSPIWQTARHACLDLHPDYTFHMWQDSEANEFVQANFPHLLPTYHSYPADVQHSDALRYLVLNRMGGFYLDLDLRCRVRLDSLRNETLVVPPANPSGVNNAFIASVAHHPFWIYVEQNLILYDLNWFGSSSITVMMSTGCHFLSTMYRTFRDPSRFGVLDQQNKLNGHQITPLFELFGSSSWHQYDAKAILRLGQGIERIKQHRWLLVWIILAFLHFTMLFADIGFDLLR